MLRVVEALASPVDDGDGCGVGVGGGVTVRVKVDDFDIKIEYVTTDFVLVTSRVLECVMEVAVAVGVARGAGVTVSLTDVFNELVGPIERVPVASAAGVTRFDVVRDIDQREADGSNE
jgi:hypothetical protein